jgi:hypothetical protein
MFGPNFWTNIEFKDLSGFILGVAGLAIAGLGVYFTKRKFDLEERIQKQREWDGKKHVYEIAVKALDIIYASEKNAVIKGEPIDDEMIKEFNKAFQEARVLFGNKPVILSYLKQMRRNLIHVRLYGKLNDEYCETAKKWLMAQLEEIEGMDGLRPIEKMFAGEVGN